MEGCDFAKQLRLKALEMAYKCGKNGSHLGVYAKENIIYIGKEKCRRCFLHP